MTTESPGTLEERVITFPDGIPGFPGSTRFALVDVAEGSAFQCLQSLDEPDVAMIVAVPWLFFPDYAPEIGDVEAADLGIESAEDAIVFCGCTLEPETTVYLNLMGPFVVNAKTRRGRQLVLTGSDHPLRAAVSLAAPAGATSG